MARYLLEFSKKGNIKYTSHLDMVRLFKRCFKRAGLAVEHSQGFNPHPKIVFGQPLSLGYEAERELVEVILVEDIEPAKVMESMNREMAPGIEIITCTKFNGGSKSIASLCRAATYNIEMIFSEEVKLGNDIEEKAKAFMEQEEILVSKVAKKGKFKKVEKQVNIRPMIKELDVNIDGNKLIMSTNIDAGSQSNLSPKLLIDGFLGYINLAEEPLNVGITRISLEM